MDIGSPAWNSVVVKGAGKLNIQVSAEQAGLFAAHAREIIRWNRRINLTAVTDPLEVAVKHYIDSIAAAPFIRPGASLLDTGSGGGFPGIPLKIVQPSLRVTLLEARRKRVNFLRHMIRSLALSDIRVLHERLENAPNRLPADGGFDAIVSRAFSDLEQFVVNALPLLNPGGCLVAYKGKTGHRLAAEMAGVTETAAARYGAEQQLDPTRLRMKTHSFVLPRLETERTLIIITVEPGGRA